MRVVTGSRNGPKRQAILGAFSKVFPGESIDVMSVAADSGVSSHPTSAVESLKGAINRAKAAKQLSPGADYYVGIEGGLTEIGGRYWEHGFVAIEDRKGRLHTALSAGIEIRGRILESILNGDELSQVLEAQFGLKDIGKSKGFYGLATDDNITRISGYQEAVIFALSPFMHPEFFA
jgi:inosine/xanthosine triphosphatase